MLIDARKKPHHAPELKVLTETTEKINRFFTGNGALAKWNKI
jgi:hypothetical protein